MLDCVDVRYLLSRIFFDFSALWSLTSRMSIPACFLNLIKQPWTIQFLSYMQCTRLFAFVCCTTKPNSKVGQKARRRQLCVIVVGCTLKSLAWRAHTFARAIAPCFWGDSQFRCWCMPMVTRRHDTCLVLKTQNVTDRNATYNTKCHLIMLVIKIKFSVACQNKARRQVDDCWPRTLLHS